MDLDTSTLTGFDREAALTHSRGDGELLAALIEIETRQLESARAALARALRIGDMEQVITAAHNLEAIAASLQARRVAGMALLVERMARCASMRGIDEALAGLDAEIDRVKADALLLN